jgi:hypothetical protein
VASQSQTGINKLQIANPLSAVHSTGRQITNKFQTTMSDDQNKKTSKMVWHYCFDIVI